TPHTTLPSQLLLSHRRLQVSASQLRPPTHEPSPLQSTSHSSGRPWPPQVTPWAQLPSPEHWTAQLSRFPSQVMAPEQEPSPSQIRSALSPARSTAIAQLSRPPHWMLHTVCPLPHST